MKWIPAAILALFSWGAFLAPVSIAQPVKPERKTTFRPPGEGLTTYPSVEAFRSTRGSSLRDSRTSLFFNANGAGNMPMQTRSLAPRPGHPDGISKTLPTLQRASNGTATWIRGRLGKVDAAAGKLASMTAAAAALAPVLDRYRAALRLGSPADELEIVRIHVDELGSTHARFVQMAGSLPVWGRDLYVHIDRDGVVYAINGRYEPTLKLTSGPARFDGPGALGRVHQILRQEDRLRAIPDPLGFEAPKVQSVAYALEDGTARPAFAVTIHANLVEHFTILVDAENGEELTREQKHCTLIPDENLGRNLDATFEVAASSTAMGTYLDANATDLNGAQRAIRVYQETTGEHYLIWDLPNSTAFTLPSVPSIGGAITLTANFSDDESNLGFVSASSNAWTDPTAVSAHANMEVTYRYFADTFGRRAINDKDESMLSVIHLTEGGASMENAFWNGRLMAYGDGGEVFSPLAGGLDVAAHEMTHGVIEHSANLVYQYQPGALNESMADVFAVFVDRDDFLLGEDIIKPGYGSALRDVSDPGSPNLLADFRQPRDMSEFQNLTLDQDNGGVHINSGIPNRAAYLVIQAIGHGDAEKIYYRALTNYLTRTSQFGDARQALEQSATDLFGAGSSQTLAVASAFDTVGITSGTTGTGDPTGNEVDPVEGDEFVALFIASGQIVLYDVATSEAVVLGATGAVTNTVTQLSTPTDGSGIYFVNDAAKLAYFDLASGEVGVFENLYLQSPGDIWNVAIAPDESIAVLASVYEQDPNLYVTDGVEVGVIALKAQTSQNGVLDESIVYPDVVSFSPNPAKPDVTFDALRRVTAGGDPIEFWSIYEVDLATKKVFNLISAQPEGISVGNITYSHTDPDLVAFNVFAEGEDTEILVADMESGDLVSIETGSLTDAARPSFSPDDTGLAYTSEATMGLYFFDSTSGTTSGVTFTEPVYHPRWFARGTATGTARETPVELPSETGLLAVYPNPFSSRARIALGLDVAARVRIDLIDLLGRNVAVLFDGLVSAGKTELPVQVGGVSPGAYIVRISGPSLGRSNQMIHVR